MTRPLCSVIIPAYNAEKFIVDALDSVFAQNYSPIEVIVVDDGSTDKTAEVVREYRQSNEQNKLKYICRKNSGPSGARNTGIKSSKSAYVAFLDADDMWTKGKLLKQIQLMEEHPDVGLLFGDSSRFSDEGNLVSSMLRKNGYNQDFFGDDFYVIDAYKKILANNNFITTGSVILRREYIEKIGFFDEELRHSEDVDFWLQIAFQYPIAYSKDLWLLRRIHKDNISEDLEVMHLGFIKVIRKHAEKYGEKIKEKGINVARCYQKKYYELGYYFFSLNKFNKARKYFRESLSQCFHFKSFLYLLFTYLGRRNIDTVRKVKLKVTR